MNDFRLQDLQLGQSAGFDIHVTISMLDTFIELSGDDNPLHEDAAYANKHGFSGRVVHGMLTAAFYSQLIGVYLPGKYAVLHGLNVQFVAPVYVGDQLTVTGNIAFISYSTRQVHVAARITNAAGIDISRAKIQVGLLDE